MARLPRWLPLRSNELLLLAAIIIVVAATALIDSNHTYLEEPAASLRHIARYVALLGVYALGAAVVIICGGIDLSTGSTIAFAGTLCCAVLTVGKDGVEALQAADSTWAQTAENCVVPLAILAAVLGGFVVGTLHAWLITSIRLPPFIATLATLVGLRSLARIVCEGVTAPRNLSTSAMTVTKPFDRFFSFLNANVSVQVAMFAVLAVLAWFILSQTVLGRHIYAVGGNEEAARLSGIRVAQVKWFAYSFAAVCSAIAGVLYVANVASARPTTDAQGYELNAIAAAVVGGCSLQGGVGTISGAVLGCVFLRVVMDSIRRTIHANSDTYEGLIIGFIVVVAVTFSQLQQFWGRGKALFPGVLGTFSIVALSVLVWLLTASQMGVLPGTAVAGGVLCLLTLIKLAEVLRGRRGQPPTPSPLASG